MVHARNRMFNGLQILSSRLMPEDLNHRIPTMRRHVRLTGWSPRGKTIHEKRENDLYQGFF